MGIDAIIFEVGSLVSLTGGYSFRGSIEESAQGDALAVQMKDVDPDRGVDWRCVTRTLLPGRKQPNWLQSGDVLFVSRGARFHATCIDEPPQPAVCSPNFYLLRVMPGKPLMPAFLAWQINQPPFQRQLQQAAEGSGQLSIRRPVLESLPLCVPTLADQQRIVTLVDLARQERRTFHQLIHNRDHQIQMLAEDLAKSAQAAR